MVAIADFKGRAGINVGMHVVSHDHQGIGGRFQPRPWQKFAWPRRAADFSARRIIFVGLPGTEEAVDRGILAQGSFDFSIRAICSGEKKGSC